jgi:hypothetical protein
MMQNEFEHVDLIDMGLGDPDLKANDGRGGPVPPGTYEMEIAEATLGSSEKGNPVLKIVAKIVTPGEAQGRNMFRSYVLLKTDFHRGRLKTLIDATGAELDPEGRFSRADLEGRHFVADVVSRSYPALDARGQTIQREGSEWVAERPMDAMKSVPAQGSAPAKVAPAGKRPQPPVNGGVRR